MNYLSKKLSKAGNSFILINTSGWILFACFIYLYNLLVFGRAANFYLHCISFGTGLLCSVILRVIYRSIFNKTKSSGGYNHGEYSLIKLLSVIIFFSLIAAFLWYTIRLHSSLLLSPPLNYSGYKSLFSDQWLIWHSSGIFWNLITMMVWSGIYIIVKLREDWNIQVEKTEKARFLTQNAHMQMLRYQINPHFLFNSLNTIRALITEDKPGAREMITELSEFLKFTLVNTEYTNIPLGDEIGAVKHYLAIEKKRYEQKLEVTYEIDEKTLSFSVLNYLVYPLIENAVTSGLRSGTVPLKIKIKTSAESGLLQISVTSNTCAEENNLPEGILILKQRLKVNYPASHSFAVNNTDHETNIIIKISNGQL